MILSILIAAGLAVSVAQFEPDPELSTAAEALLEESGAPGAAIAVIDSEGWREAAAGVRRQGAEAEAQPGDLWHMGSNTKAMTATLAARLVEQDVIAWDAQVGAVLGETFPDMDTELAQASLNDLLAHRGGVVANAGMLTMIGLAGADEQRDLAADRRRYASAVLGEAGGARGEFLYSNAGYVVAALMMETAAGETYETLMAREVFEPLGMTSAGWGPPGVAGAADQPRGHRPGLLGRLAAREPGAAADNPPALNPAGRVHLALGDLLAFLDAHRRAEDGPFLSAESWDRLHAPVGDGDYALGWGVRADGALTHAGSNTMWFALMRIAGDRSRAAVAVVNDGRIDQVAQPVTGAVAAMMEAS